MQVKSFDVIPTLIFMLLCISKMHQAESFHPVHVQYPAALGFKDRVTSFEACADGCCLRLLQTQELKTHGPQKEGFGKRRLQ